MVGESEAPLSPRSQCRKTSEKLRENLDDHPHIMVDGLAAFEPETMPERISRRRRFAEKLMERDAPHLLDPSVTPPPDEGVSSVDAMPGQDNQPIVDPNVLAFPELYPPGYVNSEYGCRDPSDEGPELVSLAGLAAAERRPVSYFDVFGEEPKQPTPMERWSHTVDTTEYDNFHEQYPQSNPLFSRMPLGESYLRGVRRAFRDNMYPYEQFPGYDPMYGDSDSNLPSLEECLKRHRAHRMQEPELQQNGQNFDADVHGLLLSPPAPAVPQEPPRVMASEAAPVTQEVENATPNLAVSSSAITTVPSSKLADVPPQIRPFACPACKKTYKYKHGLKGHMEKWHSEVPLATRELWLQKPVPEPCKKRQSKVPLVVEPAQPLSIEDQKARLPALPPPVTTPVTTEPSQQQRQPTPTEIDTSKEPMKSPQSMDRQTEKHKPAKTPKASPVQRLKCSLCSASFSCHGNLKRHIRNVHNVEDQQQVMPSEPSQTDNPTQPQQQTIVGEKGLESDAQSGGQPVTVAPQVPHPNSQVVNHQGQPGQVPQMQYQTQPVQQPPQRPPQPKQVDGQLQNNGHGNNGNVMMTGYNSPQVISNQSILQNGQVVQFAYGVNQVYHQQPATYQYAQYVPSQQMYVLQSNVQGVPASQNGPRPNQINTIYVQAPDSTVRPVPPANPGLLSTQTPFVYQHPNNQSGSFGASTQNPPNTNATSNRTTLLNNGASSGHSIECDPSMPHLTPQQPTPAQYTGHPVMMQTGPPMAARRVQAPINSQVIQSNILVPNNQIRYVVQPQGGSNAGYPPNIQRNGNVLRSFLQPGARVIGNISRLQRSVRPYYVANRQTSTAHSGAPQVRPARPNLPDPQLPASRQQPQNIRPAQRSSEMPSSSQYHEFDLD
uniref:C2H2-type domain-containing protein n=1 Tax=Panagrellus redivivus TaxID=6233 RepID=A0A7E4UZ90_PANRE